MGILKWLLGAKTKPSQDTINIEVKVKQIHDRQPAVKKRKPAPEAKPPKCPHCKFQFEKMPARKRKCPACKAVVLPRCSPSGKVKRLVTEEQAELWAVEINRKEAAAFNRQQRRDFMAEIKAGYIRDAFDFSPAPDCCEQCREIASKNPYKLADLPQPVIDTHPDCRCCVTPHI